MEILNIKEILRKWIDNWDEEDKVLDSLTVLKGLYVISCVNKQPHIAPCGNELLLEWYSDDWAKLDFKDRTIVSALISTKYILSFSGKYNETHEFDNLDRLISQIISYLEQV